MHDNADNVRQQAAASGTGAVEGEPGGRGDMQPLGLAADAKAGLVQVLDGCGGDAVAHRSDEIMQAGRGAWPYPPSWSRGGSYPEQISHPFRHSISRHQAIL